MKLNIAILEKNITMDNPAFVPHDAYLEYDLDIKKFLNDIINDVKKDKSTSTIKRENLKEFIKEKFDDFYEKCLKSVTNERVKEAQQKDPLLFKIFIKQMFSYEDYYISYFEDEIKDI